jgi:hypothetical protein
LKNYFNRKGAKRTARQSRNQTKDVSRKGAKSAKVRKEEFISRKAAKLAKFRRAADHDPSSMFG